MSKSRGPTGSRSGRTKKAAGKAKRRPGRPKRNGTTSEFGVRLGEARRAAGLSQEGFAGLTGFSQATISRYESGRQDCTVAIAQRLALVLGISVSDLLRPHPKAPGRP